MDALFGYLGPLATSIWSFLQMRQVQLGMGPSIEVDGVLRLGLWNEARLGS